MTRQRNPGQWWDATLSPLSGCTPAGAGCDHCHSIRRMKRRLPMLRGAGNQDADPHTVLLHPERLEKLRGWRKPRVVLTPMLGDYFHEQVADEFLDLAFGAMLASPQHTYCVLTKRYERAAAYLSELRQGKRCACAGGTEVNNTFVSGLVVGRVLEGKERWPIFPMASVWDQASAGAACAAFSSLTFPWGLHMEPLLAAVDLRDASDRAAPAGPHSWPSFVVVGGENGPGARPMDPAWALDLREQCRAAGVPFWFKAGGSAWRNMPPGVRDSIDLEQTREVPW